MSIVTHPLFNEKRIALKSYFIDETYIYISNYIQLSQEYLATNPNSTAHKTLENIVRLVDTSKKTPLSFNQQVQYINMIYLGIDLLNKLIFLDS